MANNYLKNVIKSVTYAASETYSDYAPNMKEFASANADFAKMTYSALKNPKMALRKSVDSLQQSKVFKALDYGAKNLIEDLRTGNFYNKERKDRDEAKLSGFDADSYNDLSEFGIDSDWESKLSSNNKDNGEITKGDAKIVESIEDSNAALASTTVNAVISSSQNEIKNSRHNMSMIYMQNERLFGGLHKDINILNVTIQEMYKLQSASLQNIDKNLSDFFTQESKLNNERNAILREMLEIQKKNSMSSSDKEKNKSNNSSKKIKWRDINVNGMPDLDAYFSLVKDNIKKQMSMFSMPSIGDGDSNVLASFMTSPLEGVVKYVVDGVIPATVKIATKELDESLSGIFGTIMGKLANAKNENDGIFGFIAKFLGVNTSVNRSVSTSKYEKGPVPFDGITRKTIIDVIPTHLRRIEAAITGRQEELFDYETGKWVTAKSIEDKYKSIRKNSINHGTYDIYNLMSNGIRSVKDGIDDIDDRESFDKAVEEFREFLYENNGIFNPNISANKNGIERYKYPNLVTHYNRIRTIFKESGNVREIDNRTGRVKRIIQSKNSTKLKIAGSVLDAKSNEDNQYRSIESDSSNIINRFFSSPTIDTHGKYKNVNGESKFTAIGSLNVIKDNLGNTIFDYLQNINKELKWFRLNVGNFGNIANAQHVPNIDVNNNSNNNREIHSFESISIANSSITRNNRSSISNNISNREKARRSAIEAIQSGRAIDLRDLSDDEHAEMLKIADFLAKDNIEKFNDAIKTEDNNNTIRNFIHNQYINKNRRNLSDVHRAINEANEQNKNTSEVGETEKNKFLKNIKNRIKSGRNVVESVIGASAESFTNILYTADAAIYEMMYKSEIIDGDDKKNKYKGFIDAMVGKMKDKFKEITDTIKRDIIDPFKERLGIDDEFKNRFKNNIMDAGTALFNVFKKSNSDVYGSLFNSLGINNEKVNADEYKDKINGISKEQRKRINKRKLISKQIDTIKSSDYLNDNFIEIMEEYGLDIGSYSNNDEARSAILPLLAKAIYDNTNNLTEFDTEEEAELALSAIKNNPKLMKNVLKNLGLNSKSNNEENAELILNQILSRKNDNTVFKAAKSDRKINRDRIADDINRIKGLNADSEEFKEELKQYESELGNYSSMIEKKDALIFKLQNDLAENTNKFREITINRVKTSDNIIEAQSKQLDAMKGNSDLLSQIANTNNIEIGDTEDDTVNNIKNKFIENESINNLNRFSVSGRETLADKYGFKGTIEEKQKMLRDIAKANGKNIDDEKIKYYNTDEALNKAYLRFVQNNANGTIGKPFSGLTTLTKGEGLINNTGFSTVPKTGVYNVTTPTHIINTEDMHDIVGGPRVSVQQALGKEKLAAKQAGFGIASNAKGTGKIFNNGVNVNPKDIIAEAKKYIPEAASGGLVGGIISTLLGIVGGPLVGAAVGAGSSIIRKSSVLQNILFGKIVDEDSGERDNSGLISKKLVDMAKKYFPEMAKYGMAGILPGLITPLGPVGGLMAGAAVGFLKNNQTFKEKLFGENGSLKINEKEKKILKNMMPGAFKGAAGGVLATLLFKNGPFGIVGNTVVGTALGIMSSTDEFKEGLLGREINGKRIGGLVNHIKDAFAPLTERMANIGDNLVAAFDKGIIDPISRFITPAIHAIPQIASIIPRKINEYFLKKKFKRGLLKFIEDHITKPLINMASKILSPITKTITSIITAPTRLLGWVGDKIRSRQIKTNNADYMTAQERIDWIEKYNSNKKIGKVKISEFDNVLSKIDTEDGMTLEAAKNSRNTLSSFVNTKKDLEHKKKKQEKNIEKMLDNYKTADGKKLSSAMKEKLIPLIYKNDAKAVNKILRTYKLDGGDTGLTREQLDSFMNGENGLAAEMKKYNDIGSQVTAMEEMTKNGGPSESALAKVFDELGLDKKRMKDSHYINKALNYIDTEIVNREANGITEEGLDNVSLNEAVDSLKENIEKIVSGEADLVVRIRDDFKNNSEIAKRENNEEFIRRENDVKAAIGQEAWDELSDYTKDQTTANSKRIFRKKLKNGNDNVKEMVKMNKKGKYNINAKQFDAAKGNISRLKQIRKYGIDIEEDAIKLLNNLIKSKYDRLIKFIKKKNTRQIFKDRKMNKNDIKFFINPLKEKYINSLDGICKIIINKGIDLSRFETIEEIIQFKVHDAAKYMFDENEEINDTINNEENESNLDNSMQEDNQIAVAQNGLGTIIGGIGKAASSILGIGKKVVGGTAKGIASLFKGSSNNNARLLPNIGSLAGALTSTFGFNNQLMQNNNFDETDKPGDNKDVVHVGGGDMISVVRDSSGNVEPDTSDSRTKTIMEKLSIKEKVTEKLQAAQMKASELISKTFDTSNVKESKGGKLSWFALLLGGAFLLKSGILKKLYDGLIKPIFVDKVIPWIKDKWENNIKPWMHDMWHLHVKPFLTETLPNLAGKAVKSVVDVFSENIGPFITTTLPNLIGSAFRTVVENLPTIIKNLIDGFFHRQDALTGNVTNAGKVQSVGGGKDGIYDQNNELYDGNKLTGMKNEKGEYLTVDQVNNKDFEKIYNDAGVEGSINENGKVDFKDPDFVGSSYVKKMINGGVHAIGMGIASGGKVTGTVKLANKISNRMVEKGGLVQKFIGRGLQAINKPIEKIEKFGGRVGNNVIDSIVDNAANNLRKELAEKGMSPEAIENIIRNGDGSKFGKALQTFNKVTDGPKGWFKLIKEKFTKNSTKTAAEAAEKATSKAIGESAEKAVVESAEKAGAEAAEKSIEKAGLKIVEETTEKTAESVTKAMAKSGKEVIEKSAEKVGENTIKKGSEEAIENLAKVTGKSDGLLAKLSSKISEVVGKLFENSTVLEKLSKLAAQIGEKAGSWIPRFKNHVLKIFNKCSTKEAIEKAGVSTVKDTVGKVIFIVFLITDFLTGMDQAESILGVKETTIVEEVVAGIINALCGFLIVPVIIPGVEFIARGIFEFIDKDFKKRQDEATEEYNKYVEENGSTWTKEEWLSRTKSVTGAVGGWMNDHIFNPIGTAIGTGIGNLFNPVKSKEKEIKAAEERLAAAQKNNNEDNVVEANAKGTINYKSAPNSVKKWIRDNIDYYGTAIGTGIGNLFNPVESKEKEIKAVEDRLREAQNNDSENTTIIKSYESKINKLKESQNNDSDNNNTHGIFKKSEVVGKLFKNILDKVFYGIGDLTSLANGNADLDKTMDKVRHGKLSIFSKEYWNDKMDNKNNTLAGTIKYAMAKLTKLINLPIIMIKSSLEGLARDVKYAGSIITGDRSSSNDNSSSSGNNTTPITSSSSTSSKSVSTGGSFLSSIKNVLGKAVNGIKSFFGFGKGMYDYGTGEYSKQIDPSVANIRYNRSNDTEYQTIGNSGCGPAAAVNVVESMYGRGNALAEAAKFSVDHGYKELDGGTKPGFFTDYFNRNGLSSQTTYNKNQIARNISNGMPTVVMGTDPNGVSSSTPFGRSPHYVTVTGTDGHGNAIVQDPESMYDNQLYPIKNIINKSSLGVSAFGKNRRNKKFGKGKWGRGKSTIIFIGDSRGVGLKGAIGDEANKHIWAVEGAMGFIWMRDTGVPSIESKIDSSKAVVIMMGVNDLLNPDWYTKYTEYINEKANKWTAKGADVYYVSVNPVGPGNYVTSYGCITNETIDTWNKNMKANLSKKVKYLDTNHAIPKDKWKTFDNVHYTIETSKLIYDIILKTVTGQDTSALSSGGSSSSSSVSSNSNNSSDNNQQNSNNNTIFSKFSSILINSRAGQALYQLLGISNNQSSDSSSNSTGNSGSSDANYSGTAEDIVEVAKNEIGTETTKYNKWLGEKDDKKAYNAFLAWAANKAKVPTSVIPKALMEKIYTKLKSNAISYKTKDDIKKIKSGDLYSPDEKTLNIITEDSDGKNLKFINSKMDDEDKDKEVIAEDSIDINKLLDKNNKYLIIRPKYKSTDNKEKDNTDKASNNANTTSSNNTNSNTSTKTTTTATKESTKSNISNNSLAPVKNNPSVLSPSNIISNFEKTKETPLFGNSSNKSGKGKWGRGNAEQIWWYLRKSGLTEAGAAGVMGNMQAESGEALNPRIVQFYKGYTDDEYTTGVDDGSYSKNRFIEDGIGYGLVQWTDPSVKKGLYEFTKEKNRSIGDMTGQLECLLDQLNGDAYKKLMNTLKTTNDVKEASTAVVTQFEKCQDYNTAAVQNLRAGYAQKFYDKLKGTNGEEINGASVSSGDTSSAGTNTGNTIFNIFSDLLTNSRAGQALNQLLGISNKSSGSSNSSSDDSSSSDSSESEEETDGEETDKEKTDGNNSSSSSSQSNASISFARHAYNEGTKNQDLEKYSKWANLEVPAGNPNAEGLVSYIANDCDAKIPESIIPKGSSETVYNKLKTNKINHKSNLKNVNIGDILFGPGYYERGKIVIKTAEPIYAKYESELKTVGSKGSGHKYLSFKSYSKDSMTNNGAYSDYIIARPNWGNGINEYKPLSKYGRFKESMYNNDNVIIKDANTSTISSNYGKGTTTTNNNIKVETNRNINYSNLITTIINILMTIADNTDKLNTIIAIMNNKLGTNIKASDVSNVSKNSESLKSKLYSTLGGINATNINKFNNFADNIEDRSINSIISAMNSIASE